MRKFKIQLSTKKIMQEDLIKELGIEHLYAYMILIVCVPAWNYRNSQHSSILNIKKAIRCLQ